MLLLIFEGPNVFPVMGSVSLLHYPTGLFF